MKDATFHPQINKNSQYYAGSQTHRVNSYSMISKLQKMPEKSSYLD